jgi:hypothetical protein
MTTQLIISLQSLSNWVDNICSSGTEYMDLPAFVDSHNIRDLQKFYTEMESFVRAIPKELSQCQQLAHEFEENGKRLDQETKKQSTPLFSLFNTDYSGFPGKSAKDLVFVLSQIRANLENLIYQLKINIE